MKILNSNVIKEGKVIDNYLTNFPQFLNKQSNSLYKLSIGQNNSTFVVKVFQPNTYVKLPYYDNEEVVNNIFISWGDGSRSKNEEKIFWNSTITSLPPFTSALYNNCLKQVTNISGRNIILSGDAWVLDNGKYVFNEDVQLLQNFYTHLYDMSGTYVINIFGDTTDLYSIDYRRSISTVTSMENNFFSGLIEIKKLADSITNLSAIFKNYPNLTGLPDYSLPINVKNCDELFAGCTGITYIPFEFNLPQGGTSFRAMFSGCTNLSTIFNQNFVLSYGTENVDNMFSDTNLEQIPQNFFNNVTSSLTSLDGMFSNCVRLFKIDNTIELPYIISLDSTFFNCQILNNMNLNFKSLVNLNQTFFNCQSLTGIGNIQINDKTSSAYQTFFNCKNLQTRVNDILVYNNLNNKILLSTFYNCTSLKGTLKEQYLWKAKNVTSTKVDTFYHCDEIENYNFIEPSWGGPEGLTYWYGSYEIQIKDVDDIYCLPLYKYTTGTSKSNYEKYRNSAENEDDLTQYDFYINYGDDTAWLHIVIDKDTIFKDIWSTDETYYGYPKTYTISISDDKYSAYDLLMDDFFCYIFKDITHKYANMGRYKITLIGKVPRFYVNDGDMITNSFITNIITINRLPFTSLQNAFKNTGFVNSNGLPNESLLEFPLLVCQEDSPITHGSMKKTNHCFDSHLSETIYNPHPPLFNIYSDSENQPFG